MLAAYHKVGEDAKHVNNWSLEGVEGLPEDGKLDLAKLGLPELSMRVRVGRNLKEFPLPGAMTKDDRVNLEAKMCAAFDKLKAMPEYGGRYNSLTPGHADFVDDAGYKQLVDDHFMFKDMAADSCAAPCSLCCADALAHLPPSILVGALPKIVLAPTKEHTTPSNTAATTSSLPFLPMWLPCSPPASTMFS